MQRYVCTTFLLLLHSTDILQTPLSEEGEPDTVLASFLPQSRGYCNHFTSNEHEERGKGKSGQREERKTETMRVINSITILLHRTKFPPHERLNMFRCLSIRARKLL